MAMVQWDAATPITLRGAVLDVSRMRQRMRDIAEMLDGWEQDSRLWAAHAALDNAVDELTRRVRAGEEVAEASARAGQGEGCSLCHRPAVLGVRWQAGEVGGIAWVCQQHLSQQREACEASVRARG